MSFALSPSQRLPHKSSQGSHAQPLPLISLPKICRHTHLGCPGALGSLRVPWQAIRTPRRMPVLAGAAASAADPGDSDASLPGGLQEPRATGIPVKLMYSGHGFDFAREASFQALIALVLLTGVGNRVLYKMALVPLRDHIFFLAQLQNLGYLAVYFTALAWRASSGKVTRAMLSIDKRPLLAVGACEAVAQLLFMVGAAHIPGALLPVVNQTYLVWSLAFASLILGARYSRSQLAGAALVMAGVVVAAVPPAQLAKLFGGSAAAAAAAPHAAVDLRYVGVCVACFAFPAIANCIKEKVFSSAAAKLGQPLDIFVVNSFGSLSQAFFVLLLLPITTTLKGIALVDLPTHMAASLRAFLGDSAASSAAAGGFVGTGAGGPGLLGCLGQHATPLLALSYVGLNLAFNVAMLNLLRSVGSVTTTLVGSVLVPLTIVAFTLPLPYLEPAVIGPSFIGGATLLMAGLVTYNWSGWRAMLGLAGKQGGPPVQGQQGQGQEPAAGK